MKKPKKQVYDLNIETYEMRAYGVPGVPRSYPVYATMGYICLDDSCDAVEDIYDDIRFCPCGSNWTLVPSDHRALVGTETDVYFKGETPECINVWPECYMHVLHCASGEEYIVPITERQVLDLTVRIKAWLRSEFDGYVKLDGAPIPKIEGEYYAAIYTDHRPHYGSVCWCGAGFYTK